MPNWSSIFQGVPVPEAQLSIEKIEGSQERGGPRAQYKLLQPLAPGFVLYRLSLSTDTEKDLRKEATHFCTHPAFCVAASYLGHYETPDGMVRDFEEFNTNYPNGPHTFWKITLPSGCRQDAGLHHYVEEEGMKNLKKALVRGDSIRPRTDSFERDPVLRDNPSGPGYVIDASDHFLGLLPADAICEKFRDPEMCFDLHYGVLESFANYYKRGEYLHHHWDDAVDRARLLGKMPLEFETNEELALKEAEWIAAIAYANDIDPRGTSEQFKEWVGFTVFLEPYGENKARDGQFSEKPVASKHGYYTDEFCRKLVHVCPLLQFCGFIGEYWKTISGDDAPEYRRRPQFHCKTADEYKIASARALPLRRNRQNHVVLCDYDTVYLDDIEIENRGRDDPDGFARLWVREHCYRKIKTYRFRRTTPAIIKKIAAKTLLEEVLQNPHLLTVTKEHTIPVLDVPFTFASCDEVLRKRVYRAAMPLPSIGDLQRDKAPCPDRDRPPGDNPMPPCDRPEEKVSGREAGVEYMTGTKEGLRLRLHIAPPRDYADAPDEELYDSSSDEDKPEEKLAIETPTLYRDLGKSAP